MIPERFDLGDETAFEALLHEALLRASEPAPFAIDVAARVMTRIDATGPAPHSDLSLAQLGRWAAAAAILGTAMLGRALSEGPRLSEIAHGVSRTTAGTATAAAHAGTAASSLIAAFVRTGAAMVDATRVTSQSLAPWHGTVAITMTALALLMFGVTTYVVGRDLRTTTP